MRVMALALGGCLCGNPSYGITEDTGGHITYILGAMRALARRPEIDHAEIVTRMFDDASLGTIHGQACEIIAPKLSITRIDSGNRAYLSKEGLEHDIPAFTAALIAELRQRAHRPDIIHAHFADAARVAAEVRRELHIPFIYTAHSLAFDKAAAMGGDRGTLAARIADENRAIAAADAVVGSSRDECERQLLAYPSADEGRIHRVRPGIDQTQASAADIADAQMLIAPFLRNPAKPLVLAIARPVEKKNLVSLVNAFAAHADLRDAANLVLLPGLRQSIELGELSQVAVIRQLVDRIDAGDLHGIVAYPRHHSQAQVRGLYALARDTGGVFVNPALTEPFGLTILEAAVHGLPVVATRNGGPADIVAEIGHGRLIDPLDEQEIGAAIMSLLTDHDSWQRASANARDRIRDVKWSNYASGLVAVVQDVVDASARGESRGVTSPVGLKQRLRWLVLCDIDNTLTGCRQSAERFRQFIEARGDIAFGVATGRSLIEARRLVREWRLPRPVVWITSVGSEIHWDRGQRLHRDSAYRDAIEGHWHPHEIGDALGTVDGLAPQAGVDQRTHKRSYFADDGKLAGTIARRLHSRGLQARVIHSHGRLLDIIPATAGKGAAMHHAARALGIPNDAVIVAGDSGNDLDMLESCDRAIVVANCERSLQYLRGRNTVYFAEQKHAAGVLEGLAHYFDRKDDLSILETAA